MNARFTRSRLADAAAHLARSDQDLARTLQAHGTPPLWARPPGFTTLLRIILEQQVSLASGRAAYNRLAAGVVPLTPDRFLALGATHLRGLGLTRQKAAYCVNVAEAVHRGEIDLRALGRMDDETARAALLRVKGIGPWTADIYLLMAMRRPDVWPAGDMALAKAVRAVKHLRTLPSPARMSEIAEAWRPYRSGAARMLWHHYLQDTGPSLRRALLAWYGRHARDLPWRRTRDPYAIWVSEVMLQQTRVETARDYYARFLTRFPTLETLARARPQSVLKAWEGLGYYARARHLHQAAREAVARYGRVPDSHDALRELPGVGSYTAAAVAAIAFGESHLPLDGNIRRVLARSFDLERPRDADYARAGEPLLEGLRRPQVGAMVQALMELGALICVPRQPRCEICPVRQSCRALAAGKVAERPARHAHAATPHHEVAVAYLRDPQGRLLLVQRPPDGLLGGLWELPGGKILPRESRERAIRRELREEVGITRLRGLCYIGRVDHAYSHFSVELHLFVAETRQPVGALRGPVPARWVRADRVSDYPVPRGTQKLLALHAEALGARPGPATRPRSRRQNRIEPPPGRA